MLSNLLERCNDPDAVIQCVALLSGDDLLMTSWPENELPTEELLPGIGTAYRNFLLRR